MSSAAHVRYRSLLYFSITLHLADFAKGVWVMDSWKKKDLLSLFILLSWSSSFLRTTPTNSKNFWVGNSLQGHWDMVLKKLSICRYKFSHWSVSTDSDLDRITTFITCANTAQTNIYLFTLMKMEYRMDIWR